MLGASLIESLIVLPGHLWLQLPNWLERMIDVGLHTVKKKRGRIIAAELSDVQQHFHWFEKIENRFAGF